MALITFEDKVSLNPQPSVADKNKVKDSDMNMIKNAINNSTTYSTTEQVVGTWIDGKPIYRKVIEVTSFTTGETKKSHNISDIDKIINVTGRGYRQDGVFQIIPVVVPPAYQSQYQISIYDINTTQYRLYLGSNLGTGNTKLNYLYLTFEYTKTTD